MTQAVTHRKDLCTARSSKRSRSWIRPTSSDASSWRARLKADRPLGAQARPPARSAGRYVAMLFEKSSLRTRTTFEVGVRELGGQAIGLQPDVALGQREPVADIARSLERWVDAVVVRTFSQRLLGNSPPARAGFTSSTR